MHSVKRLVMGAMLLAGCAGLDTGEGFDRHRYSRLFQPGDAPDKIYFDVRFSVDFPVDQPAAEATRMAWLKVWLEQRHLCPFGETVVERRPFAYLEDNPALYQQRWTVQCRPDPSAAPSP